MKHKQTRKLEAAFSLVIDGLEKQDLPAYMKKRWLQKLVSQFPPVAGVNPNNQFAVEKLAEANGSEFVPTVAEELPPIDVRDWLIEPDAAELARVSFPDQLIDE